MVSSYSYYVTSTGETSEAVWENVKRKCTKRNKAIAKPGSTALGTERILVKHNYVDRSGEASVYMDDDEEDAIYAKYVIFINERKVCSDINEKPDSRRIAPFPLKLHMMLIYIARGRLEHIASWLPHGRAIQIHDVEAFEDRIMKQFFITKRFQSFKYQLRNYGFTRLTHGPDRGAYYNEYFLRGKPWLTMHVLRTKFKRAKIRAPTSPYEEPNFYSMPFVNPNYVFNGVKVGSALMNKLANISEKSLSPSEQRETRRAKFKRDKREETVSICRKHREGGNDNNTPCDRGYYCHRQQQQMGNLMSNMEATNGANAYTTFGVNQNLVPYGRNSRLVQNYQPVPVQAQQLPGTGQLAYLRNNAHLMQYHPQPTFAVPPPSMNNYAPPVSATPYPSTIVQKSEMMRGMDVMLLRQGGMDESCSLT